MDLRQNFAAPPLRSQDARDRNEVAGYSTNLQLIAFARASPPPRHNGPQAARHAPLAPDDLAHFVLGHLQLQNGLAVLVKRLRRRPRPARPPAPWPPVFHQSQAMFTALSVIAQSWLPASDGSACRSCKLIGSSRREPEPTPRRSRSAAAALSTSFFTRSDNCAPLLVQ